MRGSAARRPSGRNAVCVLAVSDEVDDALLADTTRAAGPRGLGEPGRLGGRAGLAGCAGPGGLGGRGEPGGLGGPGGPGGPMAVELILACGDLPFEYLGSLMNALDVPLVFVPGNHDPDLSGYRLSRAGLTLRAGLPARPPWPDGAVNADGRILDAAGLRVAGLGGCRRYCGGANQYTDGQQARRARALRARARWRRLRDGRGVDVLLTHAPPRGVGDGYDPPHRGFTALHGLVAALGPAALLHGHVHPYGAPARPATLGRTVVCNVTGWHLLEIRPGGGLAERPGARDRSHLDAR